MTTENSTIEQNGTDTTESVLLVSSGTSVPQLTGAMKKTIENQQRIRLRCMGRWSSQQAIKAILRISSWLKDYETDVFVRMDNIVEKGRKFGDDVDVIEMRLFYYDGEGVYDTLVFRNDDSQA